MTNPVPFSTQIKSIELVNFTGTKSIDLLAQTLEITTYESLHESLHQASLVLYDSIGLFNNFPLIGEEFVLITLEDETGKSKTFAYVIDSIDDIVPADKSREMQYVIHLDSITTLPNTLLNVQHAYRGRISNIITEMFNQYITTPLIAMQGQSKGLAYSIGQSIGNFWKLKSDNIEESLGDDSGTIIIPNMRPLSAAKWLADIAVPQKNKDNYKYMFWQANDGFHFETVQNMYKKPTKRKLIYYSDAQIISKLSERDQYDAITNIIFSNRITTLKKNVEGYFQNSLFEINLAQLTYKTTNSSIDDYTTNIEGNKARFNTDLYSGLMPRSGAINGALETNNRVKYTFNNRMDFDKITPLSNRRENWGNSVRTSVALGHVDLIITIQGDHTIAAGDIIEIELARMEGFNEGDGNSDDKFITGKYLVSDVKNLFLTAGGVHSTVIRVNKDTYTTDPDNVKFAYGEGFDLDAIGILGRNEKDN